jgi:hypothetical protein
VIAVGTAGKSIFVLVAGEMTTSPEEPMLRDMEETTVPGPPADSVIPGTTTTPPVGSMGIIEGPIVITGGCAGDPGGCAGESGFEGSFGICVGEGSLFSSPFPFVVSIFPGIGVPLPFVGEGSLFSSPFPFVVSAFPGTGAPLPFVGVGLLF